MNLKKVPSQLLIYLSGSNVIAKPETCLIQISFIHTNVINVTLLSKLNYI